MAEQQVGISLLNYFKDLYSGHKVIYVRFLDTDFVFRTLTRKEYKYVMSTNSERMDIEDAICNIACLYPEGYDFTHCGFAGLNERVARVIEEHSGFTNVETVMSEFRAMRQVLNLETQCMDLIKAFIPEYTYEEMEEWTWSKLMHTTARAERVAALRGFDWKIEDRTEEYTESMQSISIDNQEFIKELQQNGIDPMYYFAEDLKNIGRHEVLDFPLIGGTHWNDEVILGVIREQIAKKEAELRRRRLNLQRLSGHEPG